MRRADQRAQVRDRPGHPPPAAGRHRGRLDRALRPEDRGLRPGRRPQLDRPLVPGRPAAVRRRDRRRVRQFLRARACCRDAPAAASDCACPEGRRRVATSLDSCAAKSARLTLVRLRVARISDLASRRAAARTDLRTSAMNDTVILAARRTPIGTFQGVLAGATAPQLGAAAARAALADAGLSARRHRRGDLRLRAARRPRPGPGAPGRDRRGRRAFGAGDDGQQDVRLGHEGRDARRRPDPRRRRELRARRRPRVDEQRAVPAAQGARRLPHGPRRDPRPHVLRRPAEPVGRPGDGLLRRDHGGQVRLHARAAGRVRRRVRAPRAARRA